MLTAEQHKLREFRTTASQIPTIMEGNPERLHQLFLERVGEEPPPDFSDNWSVKLGEYLEQFILDWHQRKTGLALVERGRVCIHRNYDYFAATLDAVHVETDTIYEVKVTRAPMEWVVPYYTGQVLMQMLCRPAKRGVLLISQSGAEPFEHEITFDDAYRDEMLERAHAFQLCVQSLSPPVALPKAVPPEKWRTIDLERERPNWAGEMEVALDCWAVSQEAAELHEQAATTIKKLLPSDCGRLLCQGYHVSRNRRGAVSIRSAA